MFGLSGLGLKLAIAGIVIAVIGATVTGFFVYQKSIVSDLNKTISAQAGEITTLKENAVKLKISNKSLNLEITRKSQETKDAYAEISRLRIVDVASTTRVNEVEKILRDRNRNERLASIRKSKRASLLIKLMDKEVICQVTNFYKVDGKCIRGKWVPEGGRLVPKIEENTSEPQ